MSGFRVAGTLDDALYEVEVTGRKSRPVVGSKRVAGLVRQHEGDTVLVTPVGPAYVVDGADPASVLALLSSHTQVSRVSDDAPQLVDPRPVDAVW
jgi:hypothetical protein